MAEKLDVFYFEKENEGHADWDCINTNHIKQHFINKSILHDRNVSW